MNGNQLRLLAFIAELEKQHGKAHPRVRSIAGAVGISTRATQEHLKLLKATGLIKISTRRTRSGRQITSTYTLTDAGKAVISLTSPMKQAEAVEIAFHTQNEGGRVKQDSTSWVRGVKRELPSGVNPAHAQENPTQTQETGGRVKQDSASPMNVASPLNKEHTPAPCENPPAPAAPEGPPPQYLTGIPEVDDYIKRVHARRQALGPDPLQAQVDIIEARRRAREAN